MNNRRRKVLRFADSLLVQLFSKGIHAPYEVIRDALPDDARIVDLRFDAFHQPGHNTLMLLVESEQFEEVEEGNPYPELCPMMQVTAPAPVIYFNPGEVVRDKLRA